VSPYTTTLSIPANLAIHTEHTLHREERPPLRTSSSVIVITPPRADDSDFTLDDRQRDTHRKRHLISPCRLMPNLRLQARRGGGNSDFVTFIGEICIPCTNEIHDAIKWYHCHKSPHDCNSNFTITTGTSGDEGHAATPIHSPLSSSPHNSQRQHQPSSTGPSDLRNSKSMPSRGKMTQECRHRSITTDLRISPKLPQTRMTGHYLGDAYKKGATPESVTIADLGQLPAGQPRRTRH
jgi:hypothetical protein